MKFVGIISNSDKAGRIILPSDVRASLFINPGDTVEISCESGNIQIRKNDSRCIFCRNSKDVIQYKGRNLCQVCLEEIQKLDL